MPCTIRTMQADDIGAMIEVFDAVVSADPGYLAASELQEGVALDLHTLSPERAARWREALTEYYARYPDGQFVAVDDETGEVIGFQVVERFIGTHTRYGILQDFCVLPAYRNGGVGRKLFGAALQKLQADGITRVFFESGYENHAFHGWASRWGFQPVSITFMAENPALLSRTVP